MATGYRDALSLPWGAPNGSLMSHATETKSALKAYAAAPSPAKPAKRSAMVMAQVDAVNQMGVGAHRNHANATRFAKVVYVDKLMVSVSTDAQMGVFFVFPILNINFASAKLLAVWTILVAQHVNQEQCVTPSCAVRYRTVNLSVPPAQLNATKAPSNVVKWTYVAVQFGQGVPRVTFHRHVKTDNVLSNVAMYANPASVVVPPENSSNSA